jgi:FtsZ-interacting cell division protein ZipA
VLKEDNPLLAMHTHHNAYQESYRKEATSFKQQLGGKQLRNKSALQDFCKDPTLVNGLLANIKEFFSAINAPKKLSSIEQDAETRTPAKPTSNLGDATNAVSPDKDRQDGQATVTSLAPEQAAATTTPSKPAAAEEEEEEEGENGYGQAATTTTLSTPAATGTSFLQILH